MSRRDTLLQINIAEQRPDRFIRPAHHHPHRCRAEDESCSQIVVETRLFQRPAKYLFLPAFNRSNTGLIPRNHRFKPGTISHLTHAIHSAPWPVGDLQPIWLCGVAGEPESVAGSGHLGWEPGISRIRASHEDRWAACRHGEAPVAAATAMIRLRIGVAWGYVPVRARRWRRRQRRC